MKKEPWYCIGQKYAVGDREVKIVNFFLHAQTKDITDVEIKDGDDDRLVSLDEFEKMIVVKKPPADSQDTK